jgi:inorganic triphosphatase YgiF
MARLEDHSEIELKLTVIGDDPDGLLDAVARLERLGEYELGLLRRHRLRDVYWDTPARGLREHGLTLRLRRMNDQVLFTAKGGTSAKDGVFRRYELERPATLDNWHVVRAALAAGGVDLDGFAAREGTPAEWMAACGLIVTQDRTTDRRTREVLSNGGTVAELALDHTTFRFRTLVVEYREIEVEQVGDEPIDLVALGSVLAESYPGRLEPSTMGKYKRGLTIEQQLRAAKLI